MNEKERLELFSKQLGIALYTSNGEERTFSEVTNDIRLMFNKLTTRCQEDVVSMLFRQNEKGEYKMNMSEYQSLAARTAAQHDNELVNYGLGIAGEAGEVADLIKKSVFHGHTIDIVEVKKELGDVLWYLSNIARLAGLTLDDVAVANITKLQRRYPEGFSMEASINRED